MFHLHTETSPQGFLSADVDWPDLQTHAEANMATFAGQPELVIGVNNMAVELRSLTIIDTAL